MKIFALINLILVIVNLLSAQTITWQNLENTGLPGGVLLFKGTRSSPKLQAFYLDVDLNNPTLAVRPYIVGQNATVPVITESVGAFAAINGGFFGGSTSYSSVIYPGEVKTRNVTAVTRNSVSYPVIRSLFSVDTLNQLSVDWVYHFDASLDGLYSFNAPLPYSYLDPTPKQIPAKNSGQNLSGVLAGMGGGPTLVKDGSVHVTYNEEIFWGSGVGYDNRDPRTAVGHTADNHVIMFVADGRQGNVSEDVSLVELAEIMISLGCVEAMNLDGGGSTQMAIGRNYVNSPSEQRPVPTILAVTHFDSLGLPKEPLFERIIDTEFCTMVGSGWFETANAGFWGDTPSLLHQKGPGDALAIFNPQLPAGGKCEVFGWWVASSNRCTDTPFIFFHRNGVDTVRVNQVNNGSTWSLVGAFEFSGDTSDAVIISEAATNGTYVVADAIKFIVYDTVSTGAKHRFHRPQQTSYALLQNFPNPFNPKTTIQYRLPGRSNVTLSIFNALGQKAVTLVSENQTAGLHKIEWDASDFPSGLYHARLKTEFGLQMTKLLLMK